MTTVERNSAVIADAKMGMRPKQIAEKYGITTGYVSTILSQARGSGILVPTYNVHEGAMRKHDRVETWPILIRSTLYEALQPHAERRRINVPALINSLLKAIVEDQIVNAVLDDDVAKAA